MNISTTGYPTISLKSNPVITVHHQPVLQKFPQSAPSAPPPRLHTERWQIVSLNLPLTIPAVRAKQTSASRPAHISFQIKNGDRVIFKSTTFCIWIYHICVYALWQSNGVSMLHLCGFVPCPCLVSIMEAWVSSTRIGSVLEIFSACNCIMMNIVNWLDVSWIVL